MEHKEKLVMNRSEIMRAVHSKGNRSTELKLAQYMRDHRITGWRSQYPLKANPDFAFPGLKLAVFTDGCFWHGHSCIKNLPKTNREFWERKIKRNKLRDQKANRMLVSKRWRVVRIWECELQNGDIRKLLDVLGKERP